MGCESRPPPCIGESVIGQHLQLHMRTFECVFGPAVHVVNIPLLRYCFHKLLHLEGAHSLILLVLLGGEYFLKIFFCVEVS